MWVNLRGEPVVYVVARERLRKAADDLPMYPATVADVWRDGVRHAASTAVRNPVTFSKAWPVVEDEQPESDFERVCSVAAGEADVEAMARARGFQVTKGRWGDRNVMPMRASFGDDPGCYRSEVEKFYEECEAECQHRERLEAHANLPDDVKYGWADDW